MRDLWLLKTRYRLHCDSAQGVGWQPQNETEWQVRILQTFGGGYTLQKAFLDHVPWHRIWHYGLAHEGLHIVKWSEWVHPMTTARLLLQMIRLRIVRPALKELLWELRGGRGS